MGRPLPNFEQYAKLPTTLKAGQPLKTSCLADMMSRLEARDPCGSCGNALWNKVGGFFFPELQKDRDEMNWIKDINRNWWGRIRPWLHCSFPLVWGSLTTFISCTGNLNIKALFRNSSGQRDGSETGTSNQMLSFQIAQSSITNKLLISYDLPPALLTFSFERREQRMTMELGGVSGRQRMSQIITGVTVVARGWGEEVGLLRGWGAGNLIFGNSGPRLHLSW